MSLNRYAKRVDANQGQVVSALVAAGALVDVIGKPLDLLVGVNGRFMLMEVKNPKGKNRDEKSQIDFYARWAGFPICKVDGPEAALRHLNVFRTGGL